MHQKLLRGATYTSADGGGVRDGVRMAAGEPGDRGVVEAEFTTANEQGCVRQRLRAANWL